MSSTVAPRSPILALAPRVAERIAAGEVVERPASVVKELVENALDAGASSVRVEVRGSGLRQLRVVDDGCGIPRDEIPLAFERHATSKIRGLDDLAQLTTLGFRGEALASIASVAEVDLLTAADAAGLGVEARVRGGQLTACEARPRLQGTTVTVRYLFQTVPARLKFVANARREVAAIAAIVQRYALARPDVRFVLLVEGRQAFRTTGRGLPAALVEAYGATVAEALRPLPPIPVGDAQLAGYLSERHVTRPNRSGITLLVNGRWVEARELLSALENAYRPLLPRGRHPLALLQLTVPPHALDVNVHPAKTDIKLLQSAALADALGRWIREALGRSAAELPTNIDLGLSLVGGSGALTAWARDREARRVAEDSPSDLLGGEPGDAPAQSARSPEKLSGGALPALHLIAQVLGSLLLCEGPAGLYLVDQHRAHERILYERLRDRHGAPAPTDVDPLVLELRPADAARLAGRLETLAGLGFACEWFGGRSFLVRTAPAIGESAAPLAGALADLLGEAAADEGDWQDRLLVSIACHSALRRGTLLDEGAKETLLAELNTTSAPAVCPHGSPLILHLSGPFLARQFRWR